jgi:hypothetical protein
MIGRCGALQNYPKILPNHSTKKQQTIKITHAKTTKHFILIDFVMHDIFFYTHYIFFLIQFAFSAVILCKVTKALPRIVKNAFLNELSELSDV